MFIKNLSFKIKKLQLYFLKTILYKFLYKVKQKLQVCEAFHKVYFLSKFWLTWPINFLRPIKNLVVSGLRETNITKRVTRTALIKTRETINSSYSKIAFEPILLPNNFANWALNVFS